MESVKPVIKSYRDLIVWQKSHQLVMLIINLVKSFPRSDEAIIIKKQLIRSALSIPSNIAEGYGGSRGSSYRNFLIIARRSATETDYWLFISHELQFIDDMGHNDAEMLLKEVNALLSAIVSKLDAPT